MQVLPCDSEHCPFRIICALSTPELRPMRSHRPRSLHGTQTALDVAVIGFDTVLAVAVRSLTASLRHTTFGLELTNSRWVTPQSVSGENVRWWIVGVRQCFCRNSLAASRSRFSER